jgi:hypothetical protein
MPPLATDALATHTSSRLPRAPCEVLESSATFRRRSGATSPPPGLRAAALASTSTATWPPGSRSTWPPSTSRACTFGARRPWRRRRRRRSSPGRCDAAPLHVARMRSKSHRICVRVDQAGRSICGRESPGDVAPAAATIANPVVTASRAG